MVDLTTVAASFWDIAAPGDSLDRWAVWFIALLAAFLTVVQVWQIPPAENPLTHQISDSVPSAGATPSQPRDRGAGNLKFEPSPFASNFGKTILTGLAGLAAETVLISLDGKPSGQDREFYIIWFVVLFFALLIILGGARAFAEAVRSRFALVYFPIARPAEPRPKNPYTRAVRWTQYWVGRFIRWVLSLRVALLTFIDTLINLIQGKNQTLTRVFADEIVEQHRNVLRVANTVRTRLTEVIEGVLRGGPDGQRSTVRVNISVLSADQTRVFYISRAQGSANKEFSKRSVAWVCVFTGAIRWYKTNYFAEIDKIVLFNNRRGTIPDEEETIWLETHYQERGQDYEAFAVFPVPWPQRGYGSQYVKGAIHVSFGSQEDFEEIWRVPDPTGPAWRLVYQGDQKLLEAAWCPHVEIRTALLDAVAVLGELLRGFNENIYLNSGGPAQ
jgi:hypothetical protein